MITEVRATAADNDSDSDSSESSSGDSSFDSDDDDEVGDIDEGEIEVCITDLTGNRLLHIDKLVTIITNKMFCGKCVQH